MGLIDRVPALAVIQTAGCAPMVQAFKAGRSTADPVVPETRIAILSTGDPGAIYTHLWHIVQRYGGAMESVGDMDAFKAMHTLAKTEGMAVEPAAAVAFAGLEALARQGEIKSDETVVVNCTGHTFPVEKHVLGEQWRVDIELSADRSPAPREGLASALDRLDEKTTSVLLIDDNPDDAHLIRRMLEARKSYRVFHAVDGALGLDEALRRLPDLIVLDLTMPSLDGFAVLQELKMDARTRSIPVIVVSARDVTERERQRLNGQIEAMLQKGSLSPRKFVETVVNVLDLRSVAEEKES
jgi:threonine synthase